MRCHFSITHSGPRAKKKKFLTCRYVYNFIGIEKTSLLSYMSNVSIHDDIGGLRLRKPKKGRKKKKIMNVK
jgi:hypothetical protein